MQALKEKVLELESELNRVQEENNRLQKIGERSEGLRGVITRKDTAIQSLKLQVDRLQAQIDSLKTEEMVHQAEAEKKAKYVRKSLIQMLWNRFLTELLNTFTLLFQTIAASS
jgi:hypothetical protein